MTQPEDSSVDAPAAPGDLGPKLRALRKARELSLHEVAAQTQISASFLSLVENSKSDITIGRLTRLVDFYGVSIIDLVPAPTPTDTDIVREGERLRLHSSSEGIDVFLLTPDTKREMMPMVLVFQPGAARAEYGAHRGEEFVHVIEGELLLDLEDTPTRRLRKGDSAYYPGERPHLFRNGRQQDLLRILCINAPPML